MPMPPTKERDRRHRRKQQRHDLAAALAGTGDLTEVAHREVIDVSGLDPMPVLQRGGHLGERGRHLGGAGRLDIDLIDEAGEARLVPQGHEV